MANAFVQVPPDSSGKKVDCVSLSAGGQTVVRQTVVIADPTKSAGYAIVSGGQQLVKGAFTLGSGTNQIGYLQKISASVTVQGNVALNAGAAHIGEVNISLMPAVVLAAGAAHVGEVNISAMPAVVVTSITNQVQISNISATVNVAGTLTIGGQTGNASATVGSVYTLIGGMDGALGRVALTDAAGHFVITGTVALAAGAAHLGEVNISTMPAVVLAAGAANIGTIQAISAPVVLAAGAAHVGEVNISIMPAVVLAAGANNIGTIQAISAVVTVNIGAQSAGLTLRMQGAVSHSAALSQANMPIINGMRAMFSASGAVTHHAAVFSWADKFGRTVAVLNHPSAVPAAGVQGPVTVAISSSTGVALVAAPAAARSIFVDSIIATNGSAALTKLYLYEASASATPVVQQYLAANGGGFSHQFNPPWQISAATALNMNLTVNASDVLVTVHFHVGPA